jgi:hypothetical protein
MKDIRMISLDHLERAAFEAAHRRPIKLVTEFLAK